MGDGGPDAGDVAFEACFEALTGHRPFAWQRRLYDRLVQGNVPDGVAVPTGLGKTAAIVVWLIALVHAEGGKERRGAVARRLVYIVNRRTVVDQATEVVAEMRRRLLRPGEQAWQRHEATLRWLAERLAALGGGGTDTVLAVSTLRGELADNAEWKADPARAGVIIGTIDMIGSKLLFSGYGDGRYSRAHHAGLIGQDTLIIHDEAHLSQAFGALLRAVAEEQRCSGESRGIRVLEMSATQRGGAGMLGIEREDEEEPASGGVVRRRLGAVKRLRLHEHDDLIDGLVQRALEHRNTPGKVLIYVRSPEEAQKVAGRIRKELQGSDASAEERVALLTGTIRGWERDRLVREHPVYRAMLDHGARVEQSVYLVSTSAGEVGIDIDADHMVCDVAPLDSMIQRLGRVNRMGGEGREACVDVVWSDRNAKANKKSNMYDLAVDQTLGILREWAGDGGDGAGVPVGPRALQAKVGALSEEKRRAASSPQPETRRLTDIVLDAWSLTSIEQMPGRPEVSEYLHGVAEWEPKETYVAWRCEVRVLDEAGVDEETLNEWFRACPIEGRERLRERKDRVRTLFGELLKQWGERQAREGDVAADPRVIVLDERGRARWSTLGRLAGAKKGDGAEERLAFQTVVLPVEVGGLDRNGMLTETSDAKRGALPPEEIDVAEAEDGRRRRERWLHERDETGAEVWRRLASGSKAHRPADLRERIRIPLKEPVEGTDEEGSRCDLVLLEAPGAAALESPADAPVRQTLEEHTRGIETHAKRIADRLGLDLDIKEALVLAARWHDRGKDRPVWQRYARNGNLDVPVAKSERYLHGRALAGYRHEFGSLLEAMTDPEIMNHPERDLILHLIASHHGWARPHFEPRAFDNEGPRDPTTGRRRRPTTRENQAGAVAAMQRFGRLQQRFGRWGLAWLESLLRCADALASQDGDVASLVGIAGTGAASGVDDTCAPAAKGDR